MLAVVQALHPDRGYLAQWRQALRLVLTETHAAAQVRAQDALPADLAEFTGRTTELDRLRRMARRRPADGAVVSAIEGMAGVGKTQLAVRAGHLLAGEQPFDQTLFVNLRGFDPDPVQPPADPGAVLDSFLRLLGVPGQEVPHELPARTALYRKRLAGKRTLVVLDNAADESQVEPLLPDGHDCITLITSRHRLAGLHRATRLPVDVFTLDEALDFLARATPGVPVGEDPDAAARVAYRCGYLPLALGLVAGHMRTRQGWTLTDHADWLDERHRDRRLDSGVELALSLSYQHLPPELCGLLRGLALHPGPDLDAYAAAALAATPLDAAAEQLRHLAGDYLVQTTAPGRFVMHDLVRAYAAGRAVDEDRPPDRCAALTRLFDYYLYSAAAAMDLLFPAERDSRPRVAVPATPVPPMPDRDAARGWLDTERVNLVATASHTAGHGWPHHTTRLAATLFRELSQSAPAREAFEIHTYALRAARQGQDRTAEAHALTNLGVTHWRQSAYQDAAECYRQALALFEETGDRPGQARVLNNLAGIEWHQGHYGQAREHAEQAAERYGETGDRLGQARATATVGAVHRRLGRYAEATEHYRRALALFREVGEQPGQALSLGNLGVLHERLGEHAAALVDLRAALAIYRQLGHRFGEAYLLTDLGVVYQRLGRLEEATDHHRRSIALFRELGDPAGESEACNGFGETLLAGGRPDEARGQHLAALEVAVRIGERLQQARAHDGLARVDHATGDPGQARDRWREALAIYTDLGAPEADEVRARLDQVRPRLDEVRTGR